MRYRDNHNNTKVKELKELKRDRRFKRSSGELPADIIVLLRRNVQVCLCCTLTKLLPNKLALDLTVLVVKITRNVVTYRN